MAMTERQLSSVKPHDVLQLAGRHKYHVVEAHFKGGDITLRVIDDQGWPNYIKHHRIAKPYKANGYRTEAEVEGIPTPEIKEWVFHFTGNDASKLELTKHHLEILDRVTV